ncbi:MAG: hypothetical protein MRY83_08275 [Flavobacteriales bacterium]|nr:hypothetical protein [Flavobacteriales bacterium]
MLGKNWILNNIGDFEYFKYLFMAYIQEVQAYYEERKVYPHLDDLKKRYVDLAAITEQKEDIEISFPSNLTGFDFKNQKTIFKSAFSNDDVLQDLEKIIEFCMPLLKSNLIKGLSLIDMIKSSVVLEPVGLEPMYLDEGYLLIDASKTEYTLVYQYKKSKVEFSDSGELSILGVEHVKNYKKSIAWTPENIKYDLITTFEELPNPATYVIVCDDKVPINETLIPVAKQIVYTHIAERTQGQDSSGSM